MFESILMADFAVISVRSQQSWDLFWNVRGENDITREFCSGEISEKHETLFALHIIAVYKKQLKMKETKWLRACFFNFNTNIYFTNFIVRMIISESLRIVSIPLLPLFQRASCASVESRTSVQRHQMSDTNLIIDSFYAIFDCLIVFQNSEFFFFFPGFRCWDPDFQCGLRLSLTVYVV